VTSSSVWLYIHDLQLFETQGNYLFIFGVIIFLTDKQNHVQNFSLMKAIWYVQK